MRSPARSRVERSSNARNWSSSLETTGIRACHSSSRATGVERSTGWPHWYRGVISWSPITGVTSMQADQLPRGGTTVS